MNDLTHLLPLLAIVATTACAGEVQDPPSTTNPAQGVHAEPPARPDRGDVTGVTRWFVLRSLDFGKTPDAWRTLGYDLDGKITSAADSSKSTGTCKRAEGTPSSVLADGDQGIDNNFGAHLFPTFRSLESDILDSINASIAEGGETLLVRLDGVTGDDNANVTGAVFTARHAEGVKPTFAASDRFHVVSSSLWDGVDLARPRYAFPWGYMRGGVWVSGPLERVDLPLEMRVRDIPVEIPLDRAQLSFRVADASTGVLAGVSNSKRLWAGLEPAFHSLCDGSTRGHAALGLIEDAVLASSDLVDGDDSLQDTTAPCDAMSIGIGFEIASISAPDAVVAPLAPPAPVDCGPPKP